MSQQTIHDINFDEEDKMLFSCDDLQLKADAIRNWMLPKLDVITNEIISGIIEIYEIDFYKNYSLGKSPHFRKSKNQRLEEVKKDYQYCGVSITGQRKDDKWHGLDKGTGKIPKIDLTSLYLTIGPEGFQNVFRFNYPKNFTKETYEKFFAFFLEQSEMIANLLLKAKMSYGFTYTNSLSFYEDLKSKFENEIYDIVFYKPTIEYPITTDKIYDIVLSSIILFPILNGCIQISLGKQPDFNGDLSKLNNKFYDFTQKFSQEINKIPHKLTDAEMQIIRQKAAEKTKVSWGIRWQVFQLNNWKCVSCGRSACDDIVLHVDHINPRSKGGKDELDNYQTLCNECNIGKSNNDQTDLRNYKN
jgi:hypothetical protein